MHKLGFAQKLWLPLVVSLVALLLVSVSAAWLSRQTRIDERKNDLNNIAHVGLSIVDEYAALAKSGAMSEADARKEALARLRDIRYGEDGYLLVIDSTPRMIMHPIKPATNGKLLADTADADGRHHYVSFAHVAQSPKGGFVDYVFPHPHSSEAVGKIGYVVRYAPWDWIISTGAYVDDIDAAFLETLYVLGGVFVVLALVLASLVWMINRSILRTIGGDPRYAAQVAGAIAEGDLTVAIDMGAHRAGRNDYNDSLLHVMQRMRDALTGTVRQIGAAADSVATGAREIATGSADLSVRTENQAASLEETAASMEEVTSMVRQTAEHAKTASQLAVKAAQIAGDGGGMVADAVATMRDISAASQRMVEIIAVIEGIAFQTNILALNAAVEAARAGEEGRGFAVVAAEVRSLAHRSAAAAKEVRELIGNAVSKVGSGAQLVEQAGGTIDGARDAIAQVTTLIQEIAAAASEQSSGIEQVNLAVTHMDTLTQENAALVEEAAAAAQSLTEQAVILQNALRAFRLREDDGLHARHPGAQGRAAGAAATRHGDAAEYAVAA
ncbi:cache domain-containing protein [Paraburkholderia edwinii]|uniref:Cache domain-containing protein n=1 Tax=Paraburkholderia edwinii TaxID=2861782 RepID=A0ABX8UT39_9BURK|nr:methyl-accepting chemotaxis protein [Paraburkholderia edwinii]QYD71966.1 cache domain-containing protein [Paraburkholderia edwinii]